MENLTRLKYHEVDYEQVTRQIRWLLIVITLATLPPGAPQAPMVYALMAGAALYNISRYIPALMKLPLYSNRIAMIVIDNLFVVTFIYLLSTTNTPYASFLLLLVITSTYWYGVRGAVWVVIGQTIAMGFVSTNPLYPPIAMSPWRSGLLSGLVILTIALLVERLTRAERDERLSLKRLSSDNQVARERLTALTDSLTDATIMFDGSGKILQANDAAQELAGTTGNLIGRQINDVLPVHRANHDDEPILEIAKASNTPQHHRDLVMTDHAGSELLLDISISPVWMNEHKAADYIIVCRNITNEKSLDEQREEFISVASHELRTPLAIMEAALSTALLDKAKLPAQTVKLVEQARQNVIFLAGIVKDLTTLSQARNDNIPIELKPVDPKVLLEKIERDFAGPARDKGLELKVSVRKGTPQILSTENHIHEILVNFVSNAIKYTKSGSVTVEAAPNPTDGVIFSVKDTGIGIAASDQKHLFMKFYRSEDFRTRETGGTGLGLYLCLELANRLNAKVWCRSTLNAGSTFYLEVPPFSNLKRDGGKVVEAGITNLVEQI